MKRKAVASLILIILFLVSVFPTGTLSGTANPHSNSRLAATQYTVDWWPMFHHDPPHTGYSTSTAPNTNQTLWNYTTGNSIKRSSPAVSGGIVYVGSYDKKVYALNASSGTLMWSYTTGSYVLSSPAVASGKVYVGSYDKKVYCLNAYTGAFIWSYTTGDVVESSPAVADGKVYVGSYDKKVYCLNASTGAFIWSYSTGDWVICSPAVAGGIVFIGSYNKKVYALNASSGALMWSYTTGDAIVSSPTVSSGMVYIGSMDYKVYCLNASSGKHVWNYTTGSYIGSSPAVAYAKVYVGSYDAKVYCLNASSGKHVWNYTTGSYVDSSPAVAGDKVYVGSDNCKVYAFGQPLSLSILPNSVVMDVGQSKLFTSSVSGGTSPYAYQWYLKGAPVSSATNSTWTFTPASASSYTVYLKVTDAVGTVATSNTVPVTVNAQLSVSILPASATLDVGQSQLFTSTVSGGTSPYSYQWYLNGTEVSGATNATWTFTPSSAGSYTVYMKVTDAVSAVATSNTVPVSVNGALSVTISPDSATLDVGQSKLFTSSVSGGTSPYTYQWYLNDTAVPSATGYAWTFTPSSSGSYNIYVNVTDTVSFRAKSNVASVTVNPALSVSVSPTSVVMNLGQSQLFTSTVSGGTSPYSYQWYLNGTEVSGATNATWTFTPSSAGSYTVYMKVTDSVGMQVTSNTGTVTVNIHDVAVTNVTSSKTVVGQGFSAIINVTVANQGDCTENFKVTVYANATSVASQNITLSSGSSATMAFIWNTAGFVKGNYIISAYALPVLGETDKADNNCTDGWIIVTWQGDLTDKNHPAPPGGVPDGKVDENDLWYFCGAFMDYYKIPSRLDANCDFNNDGKIDEDDLWAFCGSFIDYWKAH